jgi:outer membrane receptor for ferrienterochelin and colicins
MKKYLLVLVGLCCVLSYALAERPDYPELKKSDANIIGRTNRMHNRDKAATENVGIKPLSVTNT